MAGSYLPSMFTRGNDGLGSLFREIERTFDDFSRRSPLAGFAGFGDGGTAPRRTRRPDTASAPMLFGRENMSPFGMKTARCTRSV